MGYFAGFIWGLFPYICLVVMIVGTIYRYQTDQLRWTSKSSELLEKKLLILGSVTFHIGILFVFLGHILGLLIPIQVYNALGISSEVYHGFAIVIGGASGLVALFGISVLLYRRIAVECVRRDSDISDYIADGLLLIVILLGDLFTLGYNLANGSYEYRATVGPWIRSIVTLHPDVTLMAGVPILLQVHIALAFALFGISPFTRLIHVYSIPFAYMTRAPLLYRTRYGYGYAATIRRPAPAPTYPRALPQPRPRPVREPEKEPSQSEPAGQREHALREASEPVGAGSRSRRKIMRL